MDEPTEPSDVATAIASRVFAALSDRKGFDWWFYDIDQYLQLEIWDELVTTIRTAISDGESKPSTISVFEEIRRAMGSADYD